MHLQALQDLFKISDLVKLLNISLIHQILSNNCPPRVSSVFSLRYYQHNHHTRGNANRLLSRPLCRTISYGINSISYQSIIQWNEFQENQPDITLIDLNKTKLNSIFSSFLTNQYLP